MTKLRQKLKILSSLRIFFQPSYGLISIDILLCLVYFFLTSVKTKYEGGLVETVSRNKEIEKLKYAVIKVLVFYLIYHILDKIREKINIRLAHSATIKLRELVFGNILRPKDQELAKSSPDTISAAMNTISKDLRECSPDLFIEPFYCVIRGIVLIFFMNGISSTLTKVALCITPAKVLLAFYKRKENAWLAKKYNEITTSLATKTEQFLKIFYQQNISDIENTDTDDIIKNEKKLNSIHKQHIEDPWAFGFRKGLLEKIVQVILIWYGGMLVIEEPLLGCLQLSRRVLSKELSAALIRFEKFFDIMTIDSKCQEESDEKFYDLLCGYTYFFKQLCIHLYQMTDYLINDAAVFIVAVTRFTKFLILLRINITLNTQKDINNPKTYAEEAKKENNNPCEISKHCLHNISQQQFSIKENELNCKTDMDSVDSILSDTATSTSDTPRLGIDTTLKELDQENENSRGSSNFLENSCLETELS